MNQLFGTCVNALTTDNEIRRNGPFTGAVLQSASRCNTRVPWADHRVRASRPHALVGPGYWRLVSWWYQISRAIQVRRFIHLGDAHSKQWAAL